MKLSMGLSIGAVTTQVARLARDLWGKVIDIWENEHRNWDDII